MKIRNLFMDIYKGILVIVKKCKFTTILGWKYWWDKSARKSPKITVHHHQPFKVHCGASLGYVTRPITRSSSSIQSVIGPFGRKAFNTKFAEPRSLVKNHQPSILRQMWPAHCHFRLLLNNVWISSSAGLSHFGSCSLVRSRAQTSQ